MIANFEERTCFTVRLYVLENATLAMNTRRCFCFYARIRVRRPRSQTLPPGCRSMVMCTLGAGLTARSCIVRVPTLIDPCRPKGPQSSYILFYREKMASFKAARPSMSITVMVSLVICASATPYSVPFQFLYQFY